MSLPEEILEELKHLPEGKKQEVLDFTRFLRLKEELVIDSAMDDIITANLAAFKELA